MNYILVLFACVAAVTCNDVQVGSNFGRVIFDEKIQASPAIWRQVQKITVNASDSEVISQVVVTDQRPEKDGDAKIIEGGEGQKNVTIELQSPTVFRGFDFHVVVYAVQGNADTRLPIQISKDINVNTSDTPANKDSVNIKDIKPTVPTVEGTPITNEDSKSSAPVTTGDQTRKYRNTEELSADPIVQYVNEEKTTKNTNDADGKAFAPEVTTLKDQKDAREVTQDSADKINGPATSSSLTPALIGEAEVKKNENKTPQIEKDTFDNAKVLPKDVPQIKGIDMKIHKDMSSTTPYVSTGAFDVTTSSTENIRDQTQHNFDNISQ